MRFAAIALVAGAAPPAGAQAPEPSRVELKTDDGLVISGFWLDAHEPNAPAVLLLHNAGRDHYPYRWLWERLLKLGVNVLAVDFRGHGASQRTTPAVYDRLVARDQSVYASFIHDAEAGLAFLTRVQHVPMTRIAIVGGELGATVGFQAMAAHPNLAGLVALSPASRCYGLDTIGFARRFGKRPLLIVSAKRLADDGPRQIASLVQKTAAVQLEIFPGAEVRGTEMLGQPAAVERIILVWVRRHLLGQKVDD